MPAFRYYIDRPSKQTLAYLYDECIAYMQLSRGWTVDIKELTYPTRNQLHVYYYAHPIEDQTNPLLIATHVRLFPTRWWNALSVFGLLEGNDMVSCTLEESPTERTDNATIYKLATRYMMVFSYDELVKDWSVL